MLMRSKRKLSSTLIEPFKQIKIGVYVMGVSILFLFLVGFLFISSFVEQYKHVMEIFNVVNPQNQWELVVNDVFLKNIIKLAITLSVYILVLFTIIFKMTHRIYGPLVSIERFVEEVSKGNYEKKVLIRKGDELERLVAKLNDMAEQLHKKHSKELNRRK